MSNPDFMTCMACSNGPKCDAAGHCLIDAARNDPRDTNPTLNERGKTHGDFQKQFRWVQEMKHLYRHTPNWESLNFVQREALEMDLHKTSRILFGDYEHKDHWEDKAGYSQLGMKACDFYAKPPAPRKE